MPGIITLSTNIASLEAEGTLRRATNNLQQCFTRLASGLRINHASDDAAGLAIAQLLDVDSRVYAQGIRNLNDGISLTNVAEGALQELAHITIRQRELATQAANGTLSLEQRQALNAEANALVNEFNRIVSTTKFNDLPLLDGSVGQLRLQAGYGTDGGIVFGLDDGFDRTVGDGTLRALGAFSVTGANLSGGTTVDVTGDGILDFVAANQLSNQLDVLAGNGDGTFKAAISFAAGSSPYALAAADLNNDGKIDVVTADNGSATMSVLLGNGDGTFAARSSYVSDSGPRSISIADFNGDGIPDLVTANSTNNSVTVLLGNGDGTFGNTGAARQEITQITLNPGVGYSIPVPQHYFLISSASTNYYVWFTCDGSGSEPHIGGRTGLRVDVLSTDTANQVAQKVAAVLPTAQFTCSTPSGGTMTITNKDAGAAGDVSNAMMPFYGLSSFTILQQGSSANSVMVGNSPYSVLARDFNGDGFSDIATADNGSNSISILLGNGDGTFSARRSFVTSVGPRSICRGDFNGDGILDLATADLTSNRISVFVGNGDGTFEARTSLGGFAAYQMVTSADINGDGLADLLTADGANRVSVFIGNGNGTFNARTSFLATNSSYWLTTGDVNRDGVPDLITGFSSSNFFSVILARTMQVTTAPYLNLCTQELARDAMSVLDGTLDRIDNELGLIGSIQSRLNVALNTLSVDRESFIAAKSQITDVDIAEESAELAKQRIFQQAASSILAQANQLPSLALVLLQNL